MTAHSIVYIVLSLLSLVAVHALGSPTHESTREQHQTENTEESTQETL